MKLAELLDRRQERWKELEERTRELARRSFFRRHKASEIARFAELYRSACADLALARSYHLPTGVIEHLDRLVRDANAALYQKQESGLGNLLTLIFYDGPKLLAADVFLWIAAVLFWGSFFSAWHFIQNDVEFAEEVIGAGQLESTEEMFSEPFGALDFGERFTMAAFYIKHNGGIGLQCFALGVLGGIGGVLILLANGVLLGAVFGHMHSPAVEAMTRAHFAEFTTAHGPFELTAIVLSAAAGMRIGFAFIHTGGFTRFDAVRLAARTAVPAMTSALVLFALAAGIEAFVSPSPMGPLAEVGVSALTVKKGVAALSSALLIAWLFWGVWLNRREGNLRFGVSFSARVPKSSAQKSDAALETEALRRNELEGETP